MVGIFQPADQHVQIGHKPYTLRLTLGALAEISHVLDAKGAKALSAEMKALTPKAARLILIALLRPCHSAAMPHVMPSDLNRDRLKAMAMVFEDSFKVLNGSDKDE